MKVESLIERVLQRYAGASRYADRGTLVTLGAEELKIDFETTFERPDRFSFACTCTSSVGGDVDATYTYRIESDGPDLTMVGNPELHVGQPESLGLAIAALTGVSMGCAHTIPRLLMPEVVEGRGLFEWSRRALGEPVTIDGASHLTVYLGEGSGLMLVYVNEATLVVRRTEGPLPGMLTDYYATLTPARGNDVS